jgi:hypothetical protein
MKLKHFKYLTLVMLYLLISANSVKNSLRIQDPPILEEITYNQTGSNEVLVNYNISNNLDVQHIIKVISEKDFIGLILFYGETHPMVLLCTVFIVKSTLIYITQYLDIQFLLNKTWFDMLGMVMYYLLFISVLYKLMYPKSILQKAKYNFEDIKIEKPNIVITELPYIFKIIGYVVISYFIKTGQMLVYQETQPMLMTLLFKMFTLLLNLNVILLIGWLIYKNSSNEVYQLLTSLVFLLFAVDQTIKLSSEIAIS